MSRLLGRAMLVGLLCLSVLPAQALAAQAPARAGTAPHVGSSAAPALSARTTLVSAATFKSQLLNRTNARRAAVGCPTLRPNAALALAAQRHSRRMADRNRLSHRLSGEAALGTRIRNAGYRRWRMAAENIAWGHSTPAAAMRAWLRSPGHRANIDNCRLRDVGFGVVIRNGRPWVTQDLGRRRR